MALCYGGNGMHVSDVPAAPAANGTSPTPMQGLTVERLSSGQHVHVFHRYCQDPNGYFMVQHAAQGLIHPSIGKTDGWTEGVVQQDWEVTNYNANDFQTWVVIRWLHPKW